MGIATHCTERRSKHHHKGVTFHQASIRLKKAALICFITHNRIYYLHQQISRESSGHREGVTNHQASIQLKKAALFCAETLKRIWNLGTLLKAAKLQAIRKRLRK